MAIGFIVVDEAIEPHQHAADGHVTGIRGVHRQLALDAGVVVDGIDGEVFDREVAFAADEVGMGLEFCSLDRLDLLRTPIEFFGSLLPGKEVIDIRENSQS